MQSSRAPPGVRRQLTSGSRSAHDLYDVSQFSESSVSSRPSASSSRNPVKIAVRAIGSCFVPKETPSFSAEHHSGDFKSFASTLSGSSHGSFPRSKMKRSGREIYGKGYSLIQRDAGVMSFTIEDIHRATKNFSPSLKIGQGGFATVYKAQIDDGTLIAVKRAKKSMHGNHLNLEFQSEIQTLARIEHLNLVRFLGYLEHEDERIVLVEYVPNGTLREHLDCLHGNSLDLAARLDIAIDVAHAVTYLHIYSDHPIIHRDIKSSNILLTENLRAKVADFGFARLGITDSEVTHISTQVKGTAGYLDPEYLKTYQLTEKSDVYSFGVLLVELVSGRRPIEPKREYNERMTARWGMKQFIEGNAIRVLDPNLHPSPATNLALEKILELAQQCLAPNRRSRPSMRRCAEILWSVRKDYRELLSSDLLSQPSYLRNSSATSFNGEKR